MRRMVAYGCIRMRDGCICHMNAYECIRTHLDAYEVPGTKVLSTYIHTYTSTYLHMYILYAEQTAHTIRCVHNVRSVLYCTVPCRKALKKPQERPRRRILLQEIATLYAVNIIGLC